MEVQDAAAGGAGVGTCRQRAVPADCIAARARSGRECAWLGSLLRDHVCLCSVFSLAGVNVATCCDQLIAMRAACAQLLSPAYVAAYCARWASR